MRSLSVRLLLLALIFLTPAAFAHDVTLTGSQTFASIDGSAQDHDGAVNGVFTVSDGSLVVNGAVNCNDDTTTSACSMAFVVSGNLTVNSGGALYAENRSGGGTGGTITLTVGGDLAVNNGGIISTASKTSSGATGGNITANTGGAIAVASGGTIDSGSSNAAGGKITLAASGPVSIDGNVLSGPSRTLLAGRLGPGPALDGGTANQVGGEIAISSTGFAEPSVLIGSNASIVSQGETNGAGPVTITGCGIEVRGLVAALSEKDSAAKVSIRSGQGLLIDSRDLGVTGATLGRTGRIRADAPSGTAINKGLDLFAAEGVQILGPAAASSNLYPVTSLPGLHDSKSFGGLIRIMSTGDAVTASGNVIDNGRSNAGDTGGTIEISAKDDVNLATAIIRSVGDFNTGNPNRGGGSISVRSYSGSVIWTNGLGDVRPTGSSSGLPTADQGKINLTACGTVNTTGTSFPTLGTPTFFFPNVQTGVCSPAAPSLPAGVPPFVTCNTPPVANDAAATTNEDNSVTITLSGTDADGDPLTFSIVSGPSNGSLGPIVPVNSTSATVVYTPNADYNGADSFVYQANDGNGGTDNATVSITIAPVNDPPSFLAGPSITSLEDAGPQTETGWATAISPGPADESAQTITFTVTNDNPSLFSVQPAVDASGTLTYTAAPNAYGSANITIVAQDNGGTANGGNDTSAPQTSSITVTPVNDAPSFTAGGDVSVNEDSGAYSAAWASAISAGPNEGTQTVSFNVSNDDNSLFSVQPAISPSGVLTFTPAANASGSAVVTVSLSDDGGTADGGVDTSASVTFTISVGAVNDAPSFTGGGDVTVLEDSGSYSATWATAISAGPADESGQSVTFSVSNDNNGLFTVQPAIAPDGTLTFTLAADAFGAANVTVTLSDDGGTANGGVDTSAPQTFVLTVTAVNDAPSFTAGGDVTVNEDSGAYSAAWATAISAGPANESGQTVSFNVSNDNNALFSAQPSISPAGVLTFTPAANAFGSATVTVSLSDNGGTANGGVDTSAPVTFTITVNGINDAPTAGADAWDTFGNTELRVDIGATATPHVLDTTPSGTGVLHNDADSVEGDPFAITSVVGCADTTAPFDCTFGDGSILSLNANGTFSFVPGPGATSASFQYVVTDSPSAGTPASATGTVTITVHEMIWYVRGGAAGGNGTSVAPYGDFTALNGPGGAGDVDAAGAYIFVHNSTVNGNIELETNQRLWGEGIGLVLPHNLNGNGSPVTLVAAGTRPTINGAGGDTVTVSNVTGVQIAGLNFNSSGSAIAVTSSPLGANSASATIYSNAVLSAGAEGIDVNGGGSGGTTVTVDATDITSAGNGFDVTSLAGDVAVAFSNGSITSTGGHGISIDGTAGGNLFVTGLFNVAVSGNTASDGIRVNTATFDAVPGGAFNVVNTGTISVGALGNDVGANGVLLSNVSGALAFGTLSSYAGNGVALGVTGFGAGFTVTSGGGNLAATNGAGVSVSNATIGAANLTFTSVSSSNAANGIVLNATGSLGGLKVLGTGAANSGGTIQNATAAGILLTSTTAPSFSFMQVQNSGTDGISGTNVNGFTLISSTVSDTVGATTHDGIEFDDVTGTVTITSSVVTGSPHDNLDVVNNAGTSTFQISGSTFSNTHPSTGNNGINVTAQGTAVVTAFNLINSTLSGNRADGIQVSSEATSQIQDTLLQGNTITGNNLGADLTQNGTSSHVVRVLSNNFTGHASHALNLFTSAATPLGGALTATVQNNTIGNAGIAGSGSSFGNGIRANINGGADATMLIDNNVIRQTPFGRGIEIIGRNGNGGLDVTVTNNDVDPQDLSGFPLAAIFVQSNCASVCNTVRSDIRGNTVPAGATFDLLPTFLALVRSGASTLQLVDTPPASADCTAQLLSTNTGSASASGCTLIPGPITTP